MSEIELNASHGADNSFSWARAFRDIGVHAINTGQFPFFGLLVVVLVFLFRLPTETLSEISLEFFNNFKEYVITGYSLFVITLILTWVYIKALRKRHVEQLSKQNDLISQLKDELQLKIGNQTTGEI
ncbi:hypothetical protein LF296_12685 [Acinetobacter vivianii]|uniref:Uncharacterized protein n=1 Tax=Acinetobacter vivianii TaxID=1776742 RepID=A0AAJ6NGZ3_9GAMM|nr:hypothetical protein [Acinetobacter vivianii]WDZ50176.1 hypothetical protein LF296_12685 [Acinetobacter vivianii]